jgi:hypothetical protein
MLVHNVHGDKRPCRSRSDLELCADLDGEVLFFVPICWNRMWDLEHVVHISGTTQQSRPRGRVTTFGVRERNHMNNSWCTTGSCRVRSSQSWGR